MSRPDEIQEEVTATSSSLGKRKAAAEDLEIDIGAPEPPSKKAARKAKRARSVSNHVPPQSPSKNSDPGLTKVSNGQSKCAIWIGNLPFTVTKQDLKEFLIGDPQYQIAEAEITRINVPRAKTSVGPKVQNKGFAYVDFSTRQSLEQALQLSEKLLGGRRVLIKSAADFEGRPEKSDIQSKTDGTPSKRVFVGNLGFDITKEDLQSHFEACGRVVDIHMATFEDSGKCKGYAWVEFDQVSSAASAVRGWMEVVTEKASATGKASTRRIRTDKIEGRRLRTEFAEDKTTRYNKRFGRNAQQNGGNEGELNLGDAKVAPMREEQAEPAEPAEPPSKDITASSNEAAFSNHQGHRLRYDRYSKSTVNKLTGGILNGQGTKTTFE